MYNNFNGECAISVENGWRLKGVLRDLRESIRARRLTCKAGQVNNMCGRSQIHSSKWSD